MSTRSGMTTRLLQRFEDMLRQALPSASNSSSSASAAPSATTATTGQTVRLVPLAPPLSRALIDRNLPVLRVTFGLLCVAYAAVTTVIGVYFDFVAPLDGLPWARTISAVTGLLAAGIIFVIQIACAEHFLPLYYASLIPDTWYSYQPFGWLSARFAAVDGVQSASEVYTAVAVGVTLSFVIARFGEVLLFGQRRGLRWWGVALEYVFVLLVVGGALLWFG